MFSFYQPLVHPAHHFVGGPLVLNTKLLNYDTARGQMPTAAIMDRTITVVGLCFDTLKEGDRSAYSAAFHEFTIDYTQTAAFGGMAIAGISPAVCDRRVRCSQT